MTLGDALILILCTPMGWAGIFVLGMTISMMKN